MTTFGQDLRTAAWLRSRDLLPHGRLRRVLLGSAALVAWALLVLGAHLSSLVTGDVASSVALAASPVWLLWALAPFFGVAGGDLESTKHLAPHPVSPRLHLMNSWMGAFLDFPYLLGLPALCALGLVAAGAQGLLLVVSFTVGASAVGQVGAWLSGALRSRVGGESLLPAALALAVLIMLVGSGVTMASAFSSLPPGWLLTGLEHAAAGDLSGVLLSSSLLASPALAALLLVPPLVPRVTSIRGNPTSRARSRRSSSRPLPPLLTLTSLMVRSTLRALTTRALLLSVLSVPLFASLAFGGVDLARSSLGAFAALASAATISVNAWAFEASGVQLLLASPVSAGRLALARLLACVTTLSLVVASVLVLSSLLTPGSARSTAAAVLTAVTAVLCCSAAGTWVSTRYPVGADLDSLRARPTTLMAALVFLALGLGLLVVAALAGAFHWALAPGMGVLACWVSVAASAKEVRDGSRLASALR